MPTLGWSFKDRPADGTVVSVMASRFELNTLRGVPAFFLASLRSWKQVKAAPGNYGAALHAQPLKGVFWTVSAWENRACIGRFARTEPHASDARAQRKHMKLSTFAYWDVPAEQLPIDWLTVRAQIAQQLKSQE